MLTEDQKAALRVVAKAFGWDRMTLDQLRLLAWAAFHPTMLAIFVKKASCGPRAGKVKSGDGTALHPRSGAAPRRDRSRDHRASPGTQECRAYARPRYQDVVADVLAVGIEPRGHGDGEIELKETAVELAPANDRGFLKG